MTETEQTCETCRRWEAYPTYVKKWGRCNKDDVEMGRSDICSDWEALP